jgi:alpha-methylacyl-CoA racemase
MLLADLGADVLRIDRAGGNGWANPIVDRGRAVLTIDIRTDEGRDRCYQACDLADIVIEGFRPGVMERLGLGPKVLLKRNPRLIFGRVTGWGQQGPLARTAGHDINYIALTGALAAMGAPGDRAAVPLNLVGDFGGGSMFLAFGIMAALHERSHSGLGQVVDAAIIDGVNSLMTMFTGLTPGGRISLERADNILGGAAPYYRTYLCSDGKEIAIGPIEPQFWMEFLNKLGIDPTDPDISQDRDDWPATTRKLEKIFSQQDLLYWCSVFAQSDACVAPVLTADEAAAHPHHEARGSFLSNGSLIQAAPAPRFSRTPGQVRGTRSGEAELARWSVDR